MIIAPDNIRFAAAAAVRRPALILLVVLVMIVLLSLLAASFAFMVRADIDAVIASQQRFQARMAAESGIQRLFVMLRKNADDPDFSEDLNRWYDNPAEFQGGLVYGTQGSDKLAQRRDEDTTWDPNAHPAWRYNLVAPNYDEPGTVRYGITDECSKLDLNVATEAQLRALFTEVIPQPQEHNVDLEVLVQSLLDWREPGGAARPKGAKDDYYASLNPPYKITPGGFTTVEELLMVRGFTPWVMFGEDYNRNGLLDQNEDDADATFPPDDADGKLFLGVAAYLTVWSRELNVSNNHWPRIWLNLPDKQKLQEQLEKEFDGGIVSYVMAVRNAGVSFTSVMNLLPAPPPPEENEEEQGGQTSQPATSQPKSSKRSPTNQSQTSQPTSQATSQNAEGEDQGLSDQEQSAGASEKPRTLKLVKYEDLNVPGAGSPPGSEETLPQILDRLTVVAPGTPSQGRINFSTAPREVLATIQELTEADLDAIIAARRGLTGLEKATPAWLWTKNVLDRNKFRMLLEGKGLLDDKYPKGGLMALNSSVYTVEAVGYADHLGVVDRLNVVFEMRNCGQIDQVLYQRNLTGLGPAYNPHGLERRDAMNQPK